MMGLHNEALDLHLSCGSARYAAQVLSGSDRPSANSQDCLVFFPHEAGVGS
jgi:hypothetical protein